MGMFDLNEDLILLIQSPRGNAPKKRLPSLFSAGNVIGFGLSMVSSMQNRRYVAN